MLTLSIPYSEHVTVVLATTLAVIVAVLIHYESLMIISRFIDRSVRPHRQRILGMAFGVLVIHILEIWLFAATGWLLSEYAGIGSLEGYDTFNFLDYVFFSAVTYTTVGYGDIYALGAVRFLYGTLSLTGFVLITWSASFTFLEMQKHWMKDK
ncbi:two pore domain potassium channel family protein [Halomonas sp. TBZ9]|uniref:Two pore domain potassium channel family protein n=1 Tax=Vreelandella azerica TaxID=2732867 RepID=A0A7Y3TX35_9GAMM|nr:two pore domain potassium channel family protein [Halomonas azerica]NOG31027.1 two pore domain potassium channel family protein [Halomonas azerica]